MLDYRNGKHKKTTSIINLVMNQLLQILTRSDNLPRFIIVHFKPYSVEIISKFTLFLIQSKNVNMVKMQ